MVEAKFSQERSVAFQDVDAAGIVFYPRILIYFHDAYVAGLAEGGVSLADVLAQKSWAAPIRHVEADFLRPLAFGDTIQVCIVDCAPAEGKLTVSFEIHKEGKTAATGRSVHLFVDRSTFQRIELPPDVARIADGWRR